MLDHDIIQNRGFVNLTEGNDIVGFQLQLRMPNYRGVWASLIDGVAVTVDDCSWDRETPLWTLQGRTFSIAELRRDIAEVRWQLDEPAIITVPHPGGLSSGVHDVSVDIAIHAPYIPVEFQPSVFHAERKVTIVR